MPRSTSSRAAFPLTPGLVAAAGTPGLVAINLAILAGLSDETDETGGTRRATWVVGLSMSIAGPNDGAGIRLGDGGRRLFDWWSAGTERVGPDDRFKPPARSRAVVEEMFECGAIITGRRTFDIAGGWGGHHPVGAPFFLLTHTTPDQWVGPGTVGTVVTAGIESALEQARAVAGDRTISVGAADVAQQYLRAGLLDEIYLNLVPVLLGDGVRLFANLEDRQFDLECTRVVQSDGVTHLSYRVVK
jgi:dihydrofolate reductase